MCLTFCHVREILYDSDTEDVCGMCPHNFPDGKRCEGCAHQQSDEAMSVDTYSVCVLTAAPLPARRWCCHHGLWRRYPALEGVRVFGAHHLKGYLRLKPLETVLAEYGVEYEPAGGGLCRVQMASLSIPLVYGVPVEHWPATIAESAQSEQGVEIEADGIFSFEL
jgi:hypothetical protein